MITIGHLFVGLVWAVLLSPVAFAVREAIRSAHAERKAVAA